MHLNSEKISILTSALQERYNSIHIIRERVQTVSLWVMGLLLGGAGWLFQSDLWFYCEQKLFFIFALMSTFFVLKFFYFNDLKKGFHSQRQIASKIEKALGFYENAYFNDDNDSMYPTSWIQVKEGKFFQNSEYMVIFGFIVLILSIVFFS